jgi:Na+/proline symporter/signal transduction histidine kinase
MIDGWLTVTVALLYLGLLFAVAYFGDRYAKSRNLRAGRPTIYALSLAVYCTSWTFYGSVGLATTSGFSFLAVYLGPILVFIFGRPLIERIIKLSKSQNITSIADFLSSRYGKSAAVSAVVTVLAVAGVLPYIALQLKAVSQSVTTLVQPSLYAPYLSGTDPFGDVTFIIAMSMALFAVLFGTRHVDATEHQEGLMLAIAAESVIKIAAFLIVGGFITYWMFDGPSHLAALATADPSITAPFVNGLLGSNWLTVTFLSSVCILLLTRQFHVTVVENNSEREVGRAAWLFPLYLIAINIFVLPIAIAGIVTFKGQPVDADMFLLKLPLNAGAETLTIIAFLGGLSAATAMVIVESVALSIMICNDLVVPILLKQLPDGEKRYVGKLILHIRRISIAVIMLLAYLFYRVVGDTYGLAQIGLLSFAAITQFAPAFFGGLIWRNATATGAIAGILAGFAVWSYTLLIPYFVQAGILTSDIMTAGLFGFEALRPQALFGTSLDPLTHGVMWSMIANLAAYVAFSKLRAPTPIERLQANIFIEKTPLSRDGVPAFRAWRTSVTVGDLMRTIGRYLGEERAERSFANYAATRNMTLMLKAEADIHMMRFAENLLASAIGAASSRLVMSLTLRRGDVGMKSALKLLDDASEAIQYNRDLLQSAIDHVQQGIAVFDRNMELICWNREFREMLELPQSLGRVGVSLDQIVRHVAESAVKDLDDLEQYVSNRLRKYAVTLETFQEKLDDGRRVLEVHTNAMPQGGVVTTFTDITERVGAAAALERANETLERRVRERTAELMKANAALGEAKIKADEANLDKTRFLAAASHDVLQPLNAARLYTTSLIDRQAEGVLGKLASNIDASLEAVEEILNALLDISRMDTGSLRAEITTFEIGELLQQLKVEFAPQAEAKNLKLTVVDCSLYVRSDRKLLRRVLQNFLSNAIKYTRTGRVLIGCRRRGGELTIEVHDTGVGIPASKHELIFKEFHRLNTGTPAVHGIGLGLSIVERIGRMLGHPVTLRSKPEVGSVFGMTAPIGDRATARRRRMVEDVAPHWGQLRGCTVLCVDNERAILDGLRELLGNWECRVMTATGTAEAISQLANGSALPDIVLADYHLEEETGVDCIDKVRLCAGYQIPAILITADRSPDVEMEARGSKLYLLRKPVKPAALRALMTRLYLRRVAAE